MDAVTADDRWALTAAGCEQDVEVGGATTLQATNKAPAASELGTKTKDASLRGYTSAVAFQTGLTSWVLMGFLLSLGWPLPRD